MSPVAAQLPIGLQLLGKALDEAQHFPNRARL